MASFTVSGELLSTGRQASLTWEDGHLRGDLEAEMDVRSLVEGARMVQATVTGPVHEATIDPTDGWWAFRMVCSVFGPGPVRRREAARPSARHVHPSGQCRVTRRPRPAATERVEGRVLGEVELRRIRAQVDALPPAPGTAVELSDFDLHGPREWDPDVQPSREAHEREEQRRREEAAWRGVRAADGILVAGEPVRGGSPRPVVDPAWRFLADARTQIPQLLATLRPLWRLRDQQILRRDEDGGAGPELPGLPATVREVELDKVAEAVYEATPSPTRWRDLPELVRDEWRARAAAAVAEVQRQAAV